MKQKQDHVLISNRPMPEALDPAWQGTFRKLSPPARAILHLCSYYAPEPIPAEMLEGQPGKLAGAMDLLGAPSVAEPDAVIGLGRPNP